MNRKRIDTKQAPAAIGTYSQAIAAGKTVYLSGQIPLVPDTMEMAGEDIETQIEQVFRNLAAVAGAAGGDLDSIVKLTIYLTDLTHFPIVNEWMARHFARPYPARAALGVAELPKGAKIEVDAILLLPD